VERLGVRRQPVTPAAASTASVSTSGAIAVIGSEPGNCEFAITVDSKFGGTGLATELMRKLIDTAVNRGLKVMEGFVLAENQSMLRLARRLGFSIAPDPDDQAIRLCRLQLGSG
jgi:RimJ/RimL family protein N-acetyltransferase